MTLKRKHFCERAFQQETAPYTILVVLCSTWCVMLTHARSHSDRDAKRWLFEAFLHVWRLTLPSHFPYRWMQMLSLCLRSASSRQTSTRAKVFQAVADVHLSTHSGVRLWTSTVPSGRSCACRHGLGLECIPSVVRLNGGVLDIGERCISSLGADGDHGGGGDVSARSRKNEQTRGWKQLLMYLSLHCFSRSIHSCARVLLSSATSVPAAPTLSSAALVSIISTR